MWNVAGCKSYSLIGSIKHHHVTFHDHFTKYSSRAFDTDAEAVEFALTYTKGAYFSYVFTKRERNKIEILTHAEFK